MKAVKISGPKKVEVFETQTPNGDGTNVIIKVLSCGICGSDIHYWVKGAGQGGAVDLIMGHELGGTVVDAGSRTDLKAGDKVTSIPLNPCGTCRACRSGFPNLCTKALKSGSPGLSSPGAYAEYFVSRPDMVRKLPDTISDREAAMIEPASVAFHSVRQAGIRPGDKVLVNGGGVIGLLCASWARVNGASYIALAETNDLRGKNALEMGDVDEVIDAKNPKELPRILKDTKGGFDFCLETSGTDAGINAGMMALRMRGTLVLIGIMEAPASIMTIIGIAKELEQKSILGYLPEEFDLVMDYMSKKKLNTERFISRTVGLDGVQDAFEKLSSGNNRDVKVIIQP